MSVTRAASSWPRTLGERIFWEWFVSVIQVLRGEAIRFISVRRAWNDEQRDYEALFNF